VQKEEEPADISNARTSRTPVQKYVPRVLPYSGARKATGRQDRWGSASGGVEQEEESDFC
jgi:hypothetical protein